MQHTAKAHWTIAIAIQSASIGTLATRYYSIVQRSTYIYTAYRAMPQLCQFLLLGSWMCMFCPFGWGRHRAVAAVNAIVVIVVVQLFRLPFFGSELQLILNIWTGKTPKRNKIIGEEENIERSTVVIFLVCRACNESIFSRFFYHTHQSRVCVYVSVHGVYMVAEWIIHRVYVRVHNVQTLRKSGGFFNGFCMLQALRASISEATVSTI